MKTPKQHLTDFDYQINSLLDTYTMKVKTSVKQDFDKLLNEFKTELATISTEAFHKAILDGITNEDFVNVIRGRASEVTRCFTGLIS